MRGAAWGLDRLEYRVLRFCCEKSRAAIQEQQPAQLTEQDQAPRGPGDKVQKENKRSFRNPQSVLLRLCCVLISTRNLPKSRTTITGSVSCTKTWRRDLLFVGGSIDATLDGNGPTRRHADEDR